MDPFNDSESRVASFDDGALQYYRPRKKKPKAEPPDGETAEPVEA